MILIFIENNMTLGHFIFLVIVILFIIALIVLFIDKTDWKKNCKRG